MDISSPLWGHPVHTHVPWWCTVSLRCFRPRPLSLKSITRCCDVSTRALAIAIPDCPGGGIPDGTLGRYSSTVRTPALLPQHGSIAMGFGTACSSSSWSPPTSSTTATEPKGRLAICCRSLISCCRGSKKEKGFLM